MAGLRILHVIPDLRKGGAERLALSLCRHLQDFGNTVSIVRFREQNEYPQLSDGLDMHVIPSEVTYRLFGQDIVNNQEYLRFVDQFKPDIIHSHLTESEFVTRHTTERNITYLSHWHGIKTVAGPEGFGELLSKSGLWKWNSERRQFAQYRNCDNHFLCISDYVKRELNNRVSDTSKLHVILNGSELSEFEKVEKLRNNEILNLVSVGSLYPHKNYAALLEVMVELNGRGFEDVHLNILGDGPERPQLEAFAKSKGIDRMVTFQGFTSEPSKFLNEADVFVHPTLIEGMGLVLVEAMSCGLPVVAFNSGGIPEVVKDEDTGLLAVPGDVSGFADHILKLKNEPEIRKNMGVQGMARSKEFSMDAYAIKVDQLYGQLIQMKKG